MHRIINVVSYHNNHTPIGDIISQRISPSFVSLNLMHLATFSIAQFLYFGPMMHFWFMFLDKMIATTSNNDKKGTVIRLKSNALVVFLQMLLDQTIGSVFIIGGFFYVFELLDSIFRGDFLSTNAVSSLQQVMRTGSENIQSNLWFTLKVYLSRVTLPFCFFCFFFFSSFSLILSLSSYDQPF